MQSIGYVAVVVRDYDEAIKFYVDTLGFDLVEDTYIEAQDKRWACSLLLRAQQQRRYCWRVQWVWSSRHELAIRQEAASSSFCTLMTSGEISVVQEQGCRLCS